jgi:hypothetical protein
MRPCNFSLVFPKLQPTKQQRYLACKPCLLNCQSSKQVENKIISYWTKSANHSANDQGAHETVQYLLET